MQPLKLLSLFAGIGGFELGLERSGGFKTVAQCEIDPFCRRVLAKHWPDVKRYEDVRDLTAARLAADGIAVDAICGGFPCQDISAAGKGAGISEGTRSGLWSEFARLVGEVRPRVVFVENVAALLSGPSDRPGAWFGRVLGDLAALGYDAEWHCISAADMGAHHRRERIWIVANARHDAGQVTGNVKPENRRQYALQPENGRKGADATFDGGENVANAGCLGSSRQGRSLNASHSTADDDWEINRTVNDSGWPAQPRMGGMADGSPAILDRTLIGGTWADEPDLPRMARGVPNGQSRLKALRNAVVPQIPELLGKAYIAAMADQWGNA